MKRKFLAATALAAVLTGGAVFAPTGYAAHEHGAAPPAATQGQEAAQPAAGMDHGKMGGMGMMGQGGMGKGMMGQGGMGKGMMGEGMSCGMMGGGMGMGKGIADELGPEEREKFLDATRELRKKLHDKQFEYGEVARNPKATREELLKKKKEVWDIQQKLHEKAWEFMK